MNRFAALFFFLGFCFFFSQVETLGFKLARLEASFEEVKAQCEEHSEVGTARRHTACGGLCVSTLCSSFACATGRSDFIARLFCRSRRLNRRLGYWLHPAYANKPDRHRLGGRDLVLRACDATHRLTNKAPEPISPPADTRGLPLVFLSSSSSSSCGEQRASELEVELSTLKESARAAALQHKATESKLRLQVCRIGPPAWVARCRIHVCVFVLLVVVRCGAA